MTALFVDLWNQNCKYKDMVFRFKGPVNKGIMRLVSFTLKLNNNSIGKVWLPKKGSMLGL